MSRRPTLNKGKQEILAMMEQIESQKLDNSDIHQLNQRIQHKYRPTAV